MSRVGKRPIPIPAGVEVEVTDEKVSAKGPLGSLTCPLHPQIVVRREGKQLLVERPSDERFHRALHGTTRQLVSNLIEGVSRGFQKVLLLDGVGYRAQMQGDRLLLSVGFSHPVWVSPEPGIAISVEGTNRIIISGVDKQQVGQFAANVRAIRPVEPYKGRGIRLSTERVRLKQRRGAA